MLLRIMIYESRLSRLLIVDKIATMLALVFGRDRIKLQRAAKDLPKRIALRFRVVDAKERRRERGRKRERYNRVRGNEANISNVFPVQSGMRHRGHFAGPTTRVHVVSAGARFFLDTGSSFPSSVCCQEIYLRQRRYDFGRPRTAANNSLICL